MFSKGGVKDLPPLKLAVHSANPKRQQLFHGAVIPFSYLEKQMYFSLRQALTIKSQISREQSVLVSQKHKGL